MKVVVIGAEGIMGRRYRAILKHLGHEAECFDLPPRPVSLAETVLHAGKVIVATPTETHYPVVASLLTGKRHHLKGCDLLIEKPMAKTMDEVTQIYEAAERAGAHVYCVNQYRFLPEAAQFTKQAGDSSYRHFHHGRDGLNWDCFQIHALAKGAVYLSEDSPVWGCTINGVEIDIKNMDRAYVMMIKDFLTEKIHTWGKEMVVETTKKILALS